MYTPVKKRDGSISNFISDELRNCKKLVIRLKDQEARFEKIFSVFNSHGQSLIPLKDFESILNQSKICYTSYEISSFMSRYGKNDSVSVPTLKKILSSYKTSSNKSLAISPYRRGHSVNIDKSILDKTMDSSTSRPLDIVLDFWKDLRTKLQTIELIVDFFFIRRCEYIELEEFLESCNNILTNTHNFIAIFQEISENSSRIIKESFITTITSHFQLLDNNESKDLITDLRQKMIKQYKNFQSAFEALSNSSNELLSDNILQSVNLKVPNTVLPKSMSKYQFKKFWYNRENICKVDTCQERYEDYEYCDQHLKGILIRGEEALGKISAGISSDKCIKLIAGLFLALKNNTPFVFTGIHKRDVQALQIYLKYKQNKKVLSMTSTPEFALE
jgi:hypothetical protein